MKNFFKKIFPYIPVFLRRILYGFYENFYAFKCWMREKKRNFWKKRVHGANTDSKTNKKRILFYHPAGLGFGGTEKSLQIVSKHLDKEKYEIYYMYAPKITKGRKPYLENSNINFIPFSFTEKETTYPFYIKNMEPRLPEVIGKNKIDLLITAGTGYAEYPFNIIRNIPILLVNIFGSPSTQKNIRKHISISKEVEKKIRPIVHRSKCEVMYIPSEKPRADYVEKGIALRNSLGLYSNDVVFGRIGRADDGIFDPIGIDAFKKVVRKYPEAHYIIQSPPPMLIKKVAEENIPNVYFLEPSSDEGKIWAFHFALDILAHFRLDGESCGLNIIESMIANNPIITHRSHIWNAHLEYLDESFSRVANKDAVNEYAKYMEEFLLIKKIGGLHQLGLKAKESGEKFLIENNIARWEKWIDEIV